MADDRLAKLHDDMVGAASKNLFAPVLRTYVWPTLRGALATAFGAGTILGGAHDWAMNHVGLAIAAISGVALLGWALISFVAARGASAEPPSLPPLPLPNVEPNKIAGADWSAPWTIFYGDLEFPTIYLDTKSLIVEVMLGTHQRLPEGVAVTKWIVKLKLEGHEAGEFKYEEKPIKLSEWGKKGIGAAIVKIAEPAWLTLLINSKTDLQLSAQLLVWLRVPGYADEGDRLAPLELGLVPRTCAGRANGGDGAANEAKQRQR